MPAILLFNITGSNQKSVIATLIFFLITPPIFVALVDSELAVFNLIPLTTVPEDTVGGYLTGFMSISFLYV